PIATYSIRMDTTNRATVAIVSIVDDKVKLENTANGRPNLKAEEVRRETVINEYSMETEGYLMKVDIGPAASCNYKIVDVRAFTYDQLTKYNTISSVRFLICNVDLHCNDGSLCANPYNDSMVEKEKVKLENTANGRINEAVKIKSDFLVIVKVNVEPAAS
ncbi:hypothetical protein L9F63_022986, partial [Diploptera punctata]